MPISAAAWSIAISRAVVSNIHGPRYAALPMVLVHTISMEKPSRGRLVRAREQHRVHAGRAHRVRADVAHVVGGDGLDDAVVVERDLHVRELVARVTGRQQVLAAVLDPLDRLAEEERREHDRALLAVHEHLLAEAAADVARGDVHVALGDLHVAGEEVLGLVHRLRRARDVELLATLAVRRHDAAGLHRHRHVAVLLDVALDDVRGRSRTPRRGRGRAA